MDERTRSLIKTFMTNLVMDHDPEVFSHGSDPEPSMTMMGELAFIEFEALISDPEDQEEIDEIAFEVFTEWEEHSQVGD